MGVGGAAAAAAVAMGGIGGRGEAVEGVGVARPGLDAEVKRRGSGEWRKSGDPAPSPPPSVPSEGFFSRDLCAPTSASAPGRAESARD